LNTIKPILVIVTLCTISSSFINGQCLLDSVIINSLLIDPSGPDFSFDTNNDGMVNSNDEYAEICNTSSDTVDVSGWRIGDDDPPPYPDFQFPNNTLLPPGDCFVMVANYCPEMPANCTTPSGVFNMEYPLSGFLGNAGDVISLVDTLGNSCSVVYGSTVCSQIDLLEIPDFDFNNCDDWGGDIDGCPLLAVGDSCDFEPVVLPIEFLDFNILVSDNQKVDLEWIVIESSPRSKYYIQWTKDLNIPFTIVGEQQSYDDIGEQNTYNFMHDTPNFGLNYYRVMQVELTGVSTMSKTKVADISPRLKASIFPNMVSDFFFIKGNSDIYDVSIFDMSGRKVMTKSQLSEEEYLYIDDIDSGYYIVVISSFNGFLNMPIVKI